jgi:signal peptidase II
MNKYSRFFICFIFFTVLDQVSKLWIESHYKCPSIPSIREAYQAGKLPYVEEISLVEGVFSFSHAHNQGAAFGIMQGQMFVFAIFTIIAILFIGFTLKAMHEDDKFQNIALALIGSGAIGNAIDRARLGYVVDFLRLYSEKGTELYVWLESTIGMTEWPSFNIADAAIVVGMIMFFFHGIFLEKDEDDEEIEPSVLKENPI